MKSHIISMFGIASAATMLLTACADDFDTKGYKAEPTSESAQYEYLNDFGALKTYIDRANSGELFRLGGAVDASAFNERGLVYSLVCANYDEITFGNHMKHNFVMDADGNMNFDVIRSAIENAKNANVKIFGHTLCWHSQQRGSYLLNLIKDKEAPAAEEKLVNLITNSDCEGGDFSNFRMNQADGNGIVTPTATSDGGNNVIVVHTNANPSNTYDAQFFVTSDREFKEGEEVTLKFRAKADIAASAETQCHKAPGSYLYWNMFGNQSITTDWKEYEVSKTLAADHEGMQTVAFNLSVTSEANTFYFDDIELIVLEKTGGVTIVESLIEGGDADNGETSSILSRTPGSGDNPAKVIDDPKGTGKVYLADISAKVEQDYESQLFITTPTALKEGDKVHVSFRYRCDDTRSISTQAHGKPGDYHHWQFIGTLNATPDWQDFEWNGAISADHAGSGGCQSIAFNLSSSTDAGKLYIDDVVFEIERTGNSIPLTKEEKEEILSNDLKRWIYGMMEACDGYVTAWDVVNEAIADGGNYGVKYDEDTDDTFYWQNYLGENYVRYAVKYAREGFAEYGGNPDDLLLFVNDYNLEASYNNTAKTDGLIRMIQQWESDGVTKIDGIGTQMHVSYHMNPQEQAKQEQCVKDMFTKLKNSGKLVHVSELDMGIVDENGNAIKTGDLTFEQKQLMADYYKFIITEFFKIIPKEQRYGIVQWAATDSPEGSGWRAGEPIGIWDLNYSRKPAYAGWCEGLESGTRSLYSE